MVVGDQSHVITQLVLKLIFNQSTLTGSAFFNNQKRLRFWRFLFYPA